MAAVDDLFRVTPGLQREQLIRRCPTCGQEYGVSGISPTPAESGAAVTCPNCGAASTDADQSSDVGHRPPGVSYENKTVACLPYELEGVARAEAVDGWQLLDTTVSATAAGMIDAHFRRSIQTAPPPPPRQARAPQPAPPQATRATRAAPASAPAAAPRPNRQRRRRRAPAENLVFLALLFFGVVWAADSFGLPGILLAFWILPPLLRSLMGTGCGK